jgi:hypothetical protein
VLLVDEVEHATVTEAAIAVADVVKAVVAVMKIGSQKALKRLPVSHRCSRNHLTRANPEKSAVVVLADDVVEGQAAVDHAPTIAATETIVHREVMPEIRATTAQIAIRTAETKIRNQSFVKRMKRRNSSFQI